MKVLLTGASGFLGSHLSKKIIERGFKLRVLCRPQSDLEELNGLKFEKAFGDLSDSDSLHGACEGVDGVFHLAGFIGYSKNQRPLMDKVNVEGTANLLDAMTAKQIKKLVHFSSVVTIGGLFEPGPGLNEDAGFNLEHLNLSYFETKKKAEELVVAATKKGLHGVILNPSTVYGPGDAKKGSRKSQLKVAQGKLKFYPDGGVSIAHVDDICDAALRAWDIGQSGRRYILSGENITIKQLFEYIADAAGVEPPPHKMPTLLFKAIGQVGDVFESLGKRVLPNSENALTATMYHWYNCDRAKKELGYQVTPAKTCILDSVKWTKENHLI